MIVLVGLPELKAYLEENGLNLAVLEPEAVSSLTALVMDNQDLEHLVIAQSQIGHWSLPHVLAAARLLQAQGRRLILYGTGGAPSPMLASAASPVELLSLLRKKPSQAPGGCSGAALNGSKDTRRTTPKPEIRPLPVPPGSILFLAVAGSQRRIGCTTQAVAIYHYCKRVGLDPAIVVDDASLKALVSVMQSSVIPGGCLISGIPFVTGTSLSYDCYIRDLGTDLSLAAKGDCDCLVLIVGAKPWELANTASAVRRIHGTRSVIILSFTSPGDARKLQPLMGATPTGAAPWNPDLWSAEDGSLALYDRLLRPELEKLLQAEMDIGEEDIPSCGKGAE